MRQRTDRLEFKSEPGEWADIWVNPPDSLRKALLRGAQAKPEPGQDETYFEALQKVERSAWATVYLPCVTAWSLKQWDSDEAMPIAPESLDEIPLAIQQELATYISQVLFNRRAGLGESNGTNSSATSPSEPVPQNAA